MKTRFRKAILLAVATTFLLSSSVYAEHSHGREGRMEQSAREKKHEMLVEELGLTPEQETRLKQQREEFRNKNKELMEKMRSKRKELKQELEEPNIDRAKVDKIIGDIKNLTGEKLSNRVNKIISMKKILTPEQFEKLQDKMRQKRHAHSGSDKDKHRFKRW